MNEADRDRLTMEQLALTVYCHQCCRNIGVIEHIPAKRVLVDNDQFILHSRLIGRSVLNAYFDHKKQCGKGEGT